MKVHFTTLGCPKNQVDSELMQGMLAQAGHELTGAAEAAECLIVNTCAFIDRAREESVNTILDLARVKETGRARALIVTGCLTQRYGGEILKEIPEVNAILGTSELHRIVELVGRSEEHTSELQSHHDLVCRLLLEKKKKKKQKNTLKKKISTKYQKK